MVGTYVSPIRVYKHSFEIAMAAYERRFPTSPLIPAFLGSDITFEETSADGAVRTVERRCRLAIDAPFLLKKVAGVDCLLFVQRNTLDRRARTLKIVARNETWASRISVKENCVYSVHPDNPNWTCFEQEGSLEVKSFFGFESVVEKLAMKQYTSNIKKGKEVMEHYIQEVIREGRTYIAPFEDPPSAAAAVTPATNAVPAVEAIQKESRVGKVQRSDSANEERKIKDVSPGSGPNKIDSDYIERFLGELDPFQESELIKFRQGLGARHVESLPDDAVLLRFLRARDFNIDKAQDMLLRSLAWRKQYQVDRLLDTWEIPQPLLDYFAGGWHHHDKEDRPLYVLRLGHMDIKGLFKTFGETGVLKYLLHIEEDGLQRTKEATSLTGKPICSWTCICDLDGLGMRHLWRPGLFAMRRIIEIIKDNYPETMGRLLIVRAPRIFPIIWALIHPFIDENTRKKIVIYAGNDHEEPNGLSEFVQFKFIPHFLGGSCKCSIPCGKLIPKSHYKQYIEDDHDLAFEAHYESAVVTKGNPKQIFVEVNEAETVITWDFDVITGDAAFVVSRMPLQKVDKPSWFLGFVEHAPQIDTDHAKPVQEVLVVTEGQSVQGSHVCIGPGLYILQWTFTVSPLSPQHRHKHKTSIMFFHEVIGSEDFRGSVSSLESCASAVSVRSSGTQVSSTGLPSGSGSPNVLVRARGVGVGVGGSAPAKLPLPQHTRTIATQTNDAQSTTSTIV